MIFSRALVIVIALGLTGCTEQSLDTIEITGSLLGGDYEYFRNDEYIIDFDSLSLNNTVTLNGGTVHIRLHGFNNLLIVNSGTEIFDCTISGSDNTLDNRTGTPVSCVDTGLSTTIIQ